MPIYEYQCESCGHRLEKIQKMADEPLKDCPECETPTLKKLVSAAAFRLKGGGWYETDFKTGAKKNALHSADSNSKSGDAGSTGKGSSDGGGSGASSAGDSSGSSTGTSTGSSSESSTGSSAGSSKKESSASTKPKSSD
ncbi:MAG: putative FmdB family regulatory protein [Candidatus Azotimanducaceae bacterium]|jgi:putative FmdB family regulatory protein